MGFFPVFDTAHREQTSLVNATTGTAAPLHDPTGTSARREMVRYGSGGNICEGIVLQSRVAAYDCLCKVGSSQVVCTMLSRNSSYAAFGASDCNIPPEGSHVLIWRKRVNSNVGWILGVIDLGSYLDMNNQDVVVTSRSCYEFEGVSAYWDNTAYNILEDDDSALSLWASCNRPVDVLPGETSLKNENNCGYDIDSYSMAVTGGNSFIRLDRLDDEIRMRSTGFIKWTSHEAVSEFDDAGYISAEGRNYSYQGEWLGDSGDTGKKVEKPSDLVDKEPRPRTRWWRGFLGNLLSWFTVRPRKTKDDDDVGLVSVHVSQAGNIMARAAGGISLERYDAIPVPKRLKEPWDPEGDKEIDVTHTGLKAFSYDDPHAIGLLKSSKMAWEQKQAYQRFDELGKDFKTQQESEVKRPESDDNDPFSSTELNLSEYKGRKAGIFIGDDGSVIIRDAWGSEIVMEGGNITINTPGNVITTANRNVVSIAGETVAARGVKGADMTSDNGHVHIHSKKVVEIAGGSDDTDGGVLIESLSKSTAVMAPEDAGDTAAVNGVVIRSEEAGVSVSGKSTYVTGLDNVFVTSGDNGDTRSGNIFVDGGNVLVTAADVAAVVVESSACVVTKDVALVGSNDGSALVAGSSAMVINGDQIPIMWAPIEEPVDLSKLKDAWTALQTSDIIQPMDWKNLVDNALFSFRKSSELKTDTGLAPWNPGDGFKMYEPYWQVMKDLEVETVVSTPVKPETEAVHGTMCWPGKEAVDSGKFVTVDAGMLNVEGKYADSKDRTYGLHMDASVEEKDFTEFKV